MRSVVLQQREERDALLRKVYQKRILIDHVEQYLASDLIKLITGPRRAGKSVFALQLLGSNDFAYLNFDDELLLSSFDENAIIQALQEVYPQFHFLLLDEIQNLPHWEIWVGKLYRRGINLVITGSNARLLSGEMATMLTGRYLQIEVLPFGLKEVLNFRQVVQSVETPVQKANLLLQVEDYMVYGGFPETLALRSITRNYLSTLFDSVLLKDITKRYKVRNSNELYNLANYLLSNYGNLFSLTQLVDDLNLGSKSTAQKFCLYLEETYLFFYLPRFNNN
jgi:predicted AAA+ superfamily ATPase